MVILYQSESSWYNNLGIGLRKEYILACFDCKNTSNITLVLLNPKFKINQAKIAWSSKVSQSTKQMNIIKEQINSYHKKYILKDYHEYDMSLQLDENRCCKQLSNK